MKFLNFIISIAESIGRARAAASLSRMGRYDEARQLMLSDKL